MPSWQQLRSLHQAAPLHRVLPPRSMALLAGVGLLLAVLLMFAGR